MIQRMLQSSCEKWKVVEEKPLFIGKKRKSGYGKPETGNLLKKWRIYDITGGFMGEVIEVFT